MAILNKVKWYAIHFVEFVYYLHVIGLDKLKLHFELHDGLGEILRKSWARLWIERCVFEIFMVFVFGRLFVLLEEIEEAHNY